MRVLAKQLQNANAFTLLVWNQSFIFVQLRWFRDLNTYWEDKSLINRRDIIYNLLPQSRHAILIYEKERHITMLVWNPSFPYFLIWIKHLN